MDLLGQFFSGMGVGGIVWFVLGIILFIKEEKKHQWFFAPIVLTGLGVLVIADVILKPVVARVRPTLEMGALIVGSPAHDYSFPSGHATMSFAAAVVLAKIEPKWKWLLYVLAVTISFSRIYLGKHFPLDVVAGAVLGWGIGHASWWLAREINKRFKITS